MNNIVILLPFIILYVIFFYYIFKYNKKYSNLMLHVIKSRQLIRETKIDFNKIIAYKNNIFYVNNKKCKDFKSLTLALQQELGSINEDDNVIKSVNDIL